ncbi:MAG: M56 family metallopeptidase [Lacinutrix venerupis]
MLHYILQTIIFQLLFLMVYDVFLKNETFFNWNRFYLLTSALLSVILPFVKIDGFKTIIPQKYIFSLPEVIIGNNTSNVITLNEVFLNTQKATLYFSFNWSYILYLGSCIAIILFLIKLYKIAIIAYKNPKVKFEKALLIELSNSKHAFSFFNYIFIGKDINTEDKQTILAHELEHVKEKHSIDLLFFEILKIIFWFNPFIYLYQNRISNLHEFIADFKAVKFGNKTNYYQNLLSQVFDTQKVSFINPFFKQSLIKKRIIMLSKSKSKQINLVKYLLLIPMVLGMLFYTSCSNEKQTDTQNVEELDLKEYSYTLGKTEEMSDEKKEIHNKYVNFLKENKNFVSWETYDEQKDVMVYSIHNLNETPPEKFREIEFEFNDGTSYTSFMQYPSYNSSREKMITENLKSMNVVSAQYPNFSEDEEDVLFAEIDQVPVFPGCDTSVSNEAQKKCFSQNINKLVGQNWNVKLGKSLGLVGLQKIYTRFTIDKEGNIINIKTRAPHPELEKEAKRVVSLIPKLIPGKQDGKAVKVTFDLPIAFKIEE